MSLKLILGLSVLTMCISGCKGKDIIDNDLDDKTEQDPYKNTFDKNMFLTRASELDLFLQQAENTFFISPRVSQTPNLAESERPSAFNALKNFANVKTNNQPQLASATGFDGLIENAPMFSLPSDPSVVKKGDSCETAINTIGSNYANSATYAQDIVEVVRNTDDGALPANVKKIETEDYATLYNLNSSSTQKGTTNSLIKQLAGNFKVGGDERYLIIAAETGSANINKTNDTQPINTSEMLTDLKFSARLNVKKRNIDLESRYSNNSAVRCTNNQALIGKLTTSGRYISTISLGTNPILKDQFYVPSEPGQKNYGYRYTIQNANCILPPPNDFLNLQLYGDFILEVTRPSETQMVAKIIDTMYGNIDNAAVDIESQYEWTFQNLGSGCTVSRVVKNGAEVL